MNPSELADRLTDLKNEGTAAIASGDIASATVLNIEMTPLVWQQCEIITKSLRFAADMESLWRECPNNVTVYHGGLQDTPAWITAGLFREKDSLAYVESGFHADIYAAARKAVEKLEGKSP